MNTPLMIDARGLACPKPLMLVKSRLGELYAGQVLEVLLDDPTACANVRRFLEEHGCRVSLAVREGISVLTVSKQNQVELPTVSDDPASAMGVEICEVSSSRSLRFVVVVAQDVMGDGDRELGKILIQAAMNSFSEVSPLPTAMVFYNGGVKLVCDGSPVLEGLQLLSSLGVLILCCGTCLNYFDLMDKVRVGRVSNMLEILEMIAGAENVFRI